jgi:hypothetical protein
MRSSEAAMGGGGARRPVLRGNERKKTGARSVRTRGQNPLVILYFVKFIATKMQVNKNISIRDPRSHNTDY